MKAFIAIASAREFLSAIESADSGSSVVASIRTLDAQICAAPAANSVECTCDHPGSSKDGENSFTCGVGTATKGFCETSKVCGSKASFAYGDWDAGCSAKNQTICQCDHPGSIGAGNNTYTCTTPEGTETQDTCKSDDVCSMTASFSSGNWNAGCTPRKQLECRCDHPNNATNGMNSYTCGAYKATKGFCGADQVCATTAPFTYGDWGASCEKKDESDCHCLWLPGHPGNGGLPTYGSVHAGTQHRCGNAIYEMPEDQPAGHLCYGTNDTSGNIDASYKFAKADVASAYQKGLHGYIIGMQFGTNSVDFFGSVCTETYGQVSQVIAVSSALTVSPVGFAANSPTANFVDSLAPCAWRVRCAHEAGSDPSGTSRLVRPVVYLYDGQHKMSRDAITDVDLCLTDCTDAEYYLSTLDEAKAKMTEICSLK